MALIQQLFKLRTLEGQVYFSIEPQKRGPFSIDLIVLAAIVTVVGVGLGFLIYLIKRK